ncbi:small acid-soluble spore protein Tlp [Paenibacillus sp. PL2-23]|uniref:small acid-soluble spore protein Tlp n=1 Tax=Paenibacillus sp. PL2-23 TaxID=2100729 RepID=UPI0030FAE270
MAKPDNRADNVEHLQQHIEDTQQNIQETNEYLAEFGDEISASEKQNLQAKNERRQNSVAAFQAEKQDEMNAQE